MSAALAGHYRRTIVIAENKLLKMATLDGLTGLYNRSHFQSQARHALAACERTQEPVALLLCDIDHFKHVNDTHGHAVGDQVLQATAKIMTQNMRAGDLLARWGGEEFLALLPRTSPTAALEAAERIREAVEACTLRGSDTNTQVRVTISFGVSSVRCLDVLQSVTAFCDLALYASKDNGRNRITLAEDQ